MQMATPQTAMALLEDLRNASFATAQKELDDLRVFAATQVSLIIAPCICSGIHLCQECCCLLHRHCSDMCLGNAELHREADELGHLILCPEAAAGTVQSHRRGCEAVLCLPYCAGWPAQGASSANPASFWHVLCVSAFQARPLAVSAVTRALSSDGYLSHARS